MAGSVLLFGLGVLTVLSTEPPRRDLEVEVGASPAPVVLASADPEAADLVSRVPPPIDVSAFADVPGEAEAQARPDTEPRTASAVEASNLPAVTHPPAAVPPPADLEQSRPAEVGSIALPRPVAPPEARRALRPLAAAKVEARRVVKVDAQESKPAGVERKREVRRVQTADARPSRDNQLPKVLRLAD